MEEINDAVLKGEIDRIMANIKSIMKKIETLDPAKQKEEPGEKSE